MGMEPIGPSNSLVRFSFANVRSFRGDATISLEATRMVESGVARAVPWRADGSTLQVLPVAGVFGANASGKTSLLRAMADMRGLVLGSFRHGGQGTPIRRRPFRLDPASVALPSHFEVDVIVDGVRWQYGFDITDTDVESEYAYRFPKGRQSLVFEREGSNFQFGSSVRSVGRTLEKIVRRNSLLLSVAGAIADSELEPLFRWFAANLRLAEADSRGIRAARTVELVESDQRERVLAMIRGADLGVTEVHRESADPEFVDRMRRAIRILNGTEGEPDGSDAEQWPGWMRPVGSRRGVARDIGVDGSDRPCARRPRRRTCAARRRTRRQPSPSPGRATDPAVPGPGDEPQRRAVDL